MTLEAVEECISFILVSASSEMIANFSSDISRQGSKSRGHLPNLIIREQAEVGVRALVPPMQLSKYVYAGQHRR